MKDLAWIVFTKEPIEGKTKTRLLPRFSAKTCVDLHCAMLQDLASEAAKTEADLCIAYAASDEPKRLKSIFGPGACYFPQEGEGLGERMEKALARCFAMGYRKAILTGTDIPELSAEVALEAFTALDKTDLVFGPTGDGGYYLVGSKKPCSPVFRVSAYSTPTVLEETLALAKEAGLSFSIGRTLWDLDTPEDFAELIDRIPASAALKDRNITDLALSLAKVSVIIPTYNEEKTMPALLQELKKLQGPHQVIFADGGSSDSTRALAGDEYDFLDVPKGRANQMNAGAAASDGEILFFLHADSRLAEKPLEELRAVLAGSRAGCFGIAFDTDDLLMRICAAGSNRRAAKGIPFGDQGIFLTRRLFEELGGFPSIPIMEDYQLSLSMKEKGIITPLTEHRITTSARRFPRGIIPKLKVMAKMHWLRRLYRKGTDPEILSRMYRDIR